MGGITKGNNNAPWIIFFNGTSNRVIAYAKGIPMAKAENVDINPIRMVRNNALVQRF